MNSSMSLLEQKRLQWAKEREEMVGLCGLWGHPKYRSDGNIEKSEIRKIEDCPARRSNILPPIPARDDKERRHSFRPEEESETSGYVSDSPKHGKESQEDNRYAEESADSWYDKEGMEGKSFKNYKNEKWARHSSDSWQSQGPSKNWWFGTPESLSSDDGNRLRWGDRGVGIGHFWEPVIHRPDSRLPQLESYRPTPKWVERGLRRSEESQKADILIIHHPDDDPYKNYSSDNQTPKNFLLGQNVRLTPDVVEERERKRRRALEHQNAIRQQLEDRERKRKEERQNKLREERLEEERIRREQERERLRMEEEERRSKEREEKEKRKEEAMKEAIEIAERRAKEEKRHQRKRVNAIQQEESPPVIPPPEESDAEKKKTPGPEDADTPRTSRSQGGRPRTRKDSSSQFEQMRLPGNVQFLNNLPVDGSLALVLDNPPAENGFLVPADGVQLALLMSPGNVGPGQIIPISTPVPTALTPRGRVLTPSKFRLVDSSRSARRDKTTQTDGICCGASLKSSRTISKSRKLSRRSGRNSGGSDTSEKSNSLERPQGRYRCTPPSKYRSRSQPRHSLEDRPKWGINRPAVQYKKQSEKDLYYQKRMRERMRKTNDASTSTELCLKARETGDSLGEKLLDSEMRLLKCDTDDDDDDNDDEESEAKALKNGYRTTSDPSASVIVPVVEGDEQTATEDGRNFVVEVTIQPEVVANGKDQEQRAERGDGEEEEEEEEDTAVPGSVAFVTQSQLEAIRQIASLREGLQKLQMDFSSSRSITPYSEKNE